MKRSMLSKLGMALLAGCMTFSSLPAQAVSNQIYQRSAQEVLSSGATYEHKQIFTKDGWLNLNIVYVSTNDPYTKIDTLFSDKGISTRETVSSLAKKNDAIAAINADFFEYTNGYYPLGLAVKDGEVVSTPMLNNATASNALPAFYIKDGIPYTDFFKWDITVGNYRVPPLKVYYINKGSGEYGGIVMYTSDWKGATIGNAKNKDLTEMIVENGKVVDMRYNAPSIPLTPGAFELVLKGDSNFLSRNFFVGDDVELKINSTPDIQSFSTAIGAGSMLLKDGKRTPFNINIRGAQPRTALGITQDKSKVIMLTVDGRDISYKGVSQETLAGILLELGAYDAVNFDGGGSTTMVVGSKIMPDLKVVNKPSDGGQRKVINALGVKSTAPSMPVSKIEFKLESTDFFLNAPNKILVRGFDNIGNPLGIDYNIIKYTVEGIPGEFNGLSFIPKSTGVGTLTAEYNGAKVSTQIQVIDTVKMMDVENTDVSLAQGQSIALDSLFGPIKGVNSKGKTATISPEYIDYTLTGGIGKIENGKFIAADKPVAGAITLKVGEAVANVYVSVGSTKETLFGFESIKNMKTEASPASLPVNIMQSKDAKEGKYSLLLQYNFNAKDDTRAAYASFGNSPIKIASQADALGLWVKGNGASHWLRSKAEDAQGNEFTVDFAQNVDWTDWKYIETKLPKGLEYPIRLKSMYLVTTDPTRKDSGEILLDDLKVIRKTSVPVMDLPKSTSITDPYFIKNMSKASNAPRFAITQSINTGDANLKTAYQKTFTSFFNGYSNVFTPINVPFSHNAAKTLTGSRMYDYSCCDVIQLDNSKGGIRLTGWQQWPWFISKLEASTKENIVVMLSSSMFDSKGFKDSLEEGLLQEMLEKKAAEGKNVYLAYAGNKNTTKFENGVRYLSYPSTSVYEKTDFKSYTSLIFEMKNNQLYYGYLPAYADIAYTPSKTTTAPTTASGNKKMRVNVESRLNVRDLPNGAVVEKVENGSIVEVLKVATQTIDGYTWQKIKTLSGTVGWVATDYLVAE